MRIALIILLFLSSVSLATEVKKTGPHTATISKITALEIENSDLKVSNYIQYISTLQMAAQNANAQMQAEVENGSQLRAEVIKATGFNKDKVKIDTQSRVVTESE